MTTAAMVPRTLATKALREARTGAAQGDDRHEILGRATVACAQRVALLIEDGDDVAARAHAAAHAMLRASAHRLVERRERAAAAQAAETPSPGRGSARTTWPTSGCSRESEPSSPPMRPPGRRSGPRGAARARVLGWLDDYGEVVLGPRPSIGRTP